MSTFSPLTRRSLNSFQPRPTVHPERATGDYGGLMGMPAVEQVQPFKYSSKELDREAGLDLLDFAARLYDPLLGRFFSPDNYVQMPDNSQNFNRYSYCLNNPLKYTDPSGNMFISLTAFGIASTIF